MANQAKALGTSVSYISAIELGTRPIPPEYASRVCNWLGLSHEEVQELESLAGAEQKTVTFHPRDRERAAIAADFAKALNDMAVEELQRLRRMLSARRTGKAHPTSDLREWAQLARACFELGSVVSFNIMDIIENKLSNIDQNFSLAVIPDQELGGQVAAYAAAVHGAVEQIVFSEHAYSIASDPTPDGRFMAAHEFAHWLVHPNRKRPKPFKRYGSRSHFMESEADYFARQFLMPDAIARQFKTPWLLALACNVPIRHAEKRLAELEFREPDRSKITEQFGELLARLRGEVPKVSPNTDNDSERNKAGIVRPIRSNKGVARPSAGRPKAQLSFFDSWQPLLPREKSLAVESDFRQMIEALGYYSGHRRTETLTVASPDSSGQPSKRARMDRSAEWYRKYGWRS
jgi:Zn-dependent peptidase ImmA (M78 family)/transcriptional regulator with XRE-family HTH domain